MSREPVLVVGGEPGTQRHLASLLQRWGYTPMVARSPEEAFAALEDTRFLFSLVDGEVARVYGVELFQRLRSRGGDPGPIVLIADPNAIAWDQELPAPGADATLEKPIDLAALENAVQHVLSGRGRSGAEVSAGLDSATLEQQIALWQSEDAEGVREHPTGRPGGCSGSDPWTNGHGKACRSPGDPPGVAPPDPARLSLAPSRRLPGRPRGRQNARPLAEPSSKRAGTGSKRPGC